jgi:hypothetical protein
MKTFYKQIDKNPMLVPLGFWSLSCFGSFLGEGSSSSKTPQTLFAKRRACGKRFN